MDDFDQGMLRCEHNAPLYDCPDPVHTTPLTTMGHVEAETETVTVHYYHGHATLETRITDRDSSMFGGSIATPVKCDHRHKTREEAQKCGERLGRRKAREMNEANGVGK